MSRTVWTVGYTMNGCTVNTKSFDTVGRAESFRDWVHQKGGDTYGPPMPEHLRWA